jgi:phage-related protein
MEPQKFRSVKFYKDYFETFFIRQRQKVQDKTGNLIILMNGFQKKTQKAPVDELSKAIRLKKEYYEEKRLGKGP